MRCAEEFRELLRQTGATAIFITHSIEEALWLGARLMVFERPARIAYETVLRADMSEAEREAVRGRIREVLSGEARGQCPLTDGVYDRFDPAGPSPVLRLCRRPEPSLAAVFNDASARCQRWSDTIQTSVRVGGYGPFWL